MVILEVGNSYSQVKGLKIPEFRALREALSYTEDPKSAYFSGGYVKTKYLLDKKGFFPTGLLKRVLSCLNESLIKYALIDKRVRPSVKPAFKKLPGVKLYPAQRQAVAAALAKERGIVSMPTGSGKSIVIAYIAAALKVKTLIVVPTLEIKRQLLETIEKLIPDNSLITILNIDSSSLKDEHKYDCLIIDECHHTAAKTYQKLNKSVWGGIYWRFYFTATPFRNQEHEELLFEGIAGEVIYKLTYKDAVRDGYIVPIEAYYIDLPKQKTGAYTWQEVYSELVVNNTHRNGVINGLLNSLHSADISALCLVKEIRHGENLTWHAFAHGQDETSRELIQDFNSGGIKVLVGTTGILGEGVDTKPAEYIIIAGLGKAKSAFQQQCGRGVRKYPGKESCKIILFRDASHKFLLRHFKEQCKILKDEYGVTPIKLEGM